MRIVVGIDHSQAAERAASLAARLSFRDPQLHLVHVVGGADVYGFATEIPPAPELIERLISEQMESGRRRLVECADIARAIAPGIVLSSEMRRGHIANEILASAQSEGADLVAVGSMTGAVEAILLGSVSRKLLAACPQSLLIAKDRALGAGPLRAVFATDHSSYAKGCIDLLAKLAPKGFGHLTVMSSYPKQLVGVMRSVVEHFRADVSTWVEKNLDDENQSAAKKLDTLHCTVDCKVMSGPPVPAIKKVAEEVDADVIIVGAQGHGFIDRMLTGSVSHQIALETNRHVLILRTPMGERS